MKLKWSKEYLEQELDEKNERLMNWKNQSLCLDFLDDLLRMKTMKRLWRWGKEERENNKFIR